jgi:CDP-paratose 2-epimerase
MSELGVVEWFHVGERQRVERVVGMLEALGVRRLRTGVSWADWHTPEGVEWYAWLLPRLGASFELLPCINHTPPSRGVVPTIQSPPKRPRDFADFIDELVDLHGDSFAWIELWNEPNNLNDWDWTLDPDWQLFCEMVGAAGYWARQLGKKVVLGGMCPLDPHWLALMGQRGVLGVVDAVGLHAFPGGWTTRWQGWHDAVSRAREVLDVHAPDVETWITEVGYSTWNHDEIGQLRCLVEALDAPAARVYWYAAEDLGPLRSACDGFHVDPRQYGFGLADDMGRLKLAGRTLGAVGIAGARELSADAEPRRRRRSSPVTVITGGAGFIGTNLAELLLGRGERVRIVDNLSRAGSEANLRELREHHGAQLEYLPVDVRDRPSLRDAVRGATSVFHFAAQVAVTSSLDDPRLDFQVNLQGTVQLLEELCRLPEPPPLVFTSTNKVYGSLDDVQVERFDEQWLPSDRRLRRRGVDETRPLSFATPYGCSKGGADQYVLDHARTFGLPATVFRMSCIYGRHQHGNEDQGWVAHFLVSLLAGRAVTIYGDGAQVRDVLHADDLVEAMLLARSRIGEVAGRPFNVGGGPRNAISLLGLLGQMEELHGSLPDVTFAPARACDQRWYVSDTSELQRALGWQPTIGASDGIASLYAWLARNRRPAASASL